MEEIKKAQEQLAKEIDAKLELVENRVKEGSENAVKDLKETVKNMTEKYQSLQEQIDKYEVEKKRLADNRKEEAKGLEDILEENASFKSYREGNSLKARIELESKDILTKATMTQAASLSGQVIDPTRVPGVVNDPVRARHVREFLASGSTNSNTIYYVEETAYTNAAATVGEGALKPQSDLTLTQKSAPVRKIATHMRISSEMLDDIPQLRSYISQRGPSKLMVVEDSQLLYGDGTGNNLTGLTVQAIAPDFTAQDGKIKNEIDVLRAAIAQVRQEEYAASVIMLNPDDVAKLDLLKDADGSYLFPTWIVGVNQQLVGGVRIIENTAITAGNFFVGDLQRAAQLFDRTGMAVEFYNQDQDNAVLNLVTVVIEERLALPIYRPSALVYGDFASAIANYSA